MKKQQKTTPEDLQVKATEFVDHIRQAQLAAVHWWSLIDATLEHAKYGQGKEEPLPTWALKILEDGGKLKGDYDFHRQHLEDATEMYRLAIGRGSNYRYEIWTSRGHRFEIGHESFAQAKESLDRVLERYPDAYISRVHIKSPCYGAVAPELLTSLIGRIYWAGTTLPNRDHGNIYHLQDETGRTVSCDAATLSEHPYLFPRMTSTCRERIEWDIKDDQERNARRAA